MLNIIKVSLPKKGCIINKQNKKKISYVYYATKYYRNDNGVSITNRILIGKLDESSGLLIPNNNYFDLFDVDIDIKTKN